MITIISCLIVGFIVGYVFFKLYNEYELSKYKKEYTEKRNNILLEEGFIKPKYYGYKGGYSKVTSCISCGRTGLYEDQHPVNFCKKCGGKVKEKGAMIWEVRDNILKWHAPHNK